MLTRNQLPVNKRRALLSRKIYAFYKFVLNDALLVFTFLCGKSLELAARMILLVRQPVNCHQLSKEVWPFDPVNDSW